MDETASELVRELGARAPQHVVDRIVVAVRDNDVRRLNGLNRLLRLVEHRLAAQCDAGRFMAIGGASQREGLDVRA